eukprot:m.155108 g.155108  ORF g.155108 m.155108 type:complete len:300 (+) comp20804_c0_seq1:645-1544(+)
MLLYLWWSTSTLLPFSLPLFLKLSFLRLCSCSSSIPSTCSRRVNLAWNDFSSSRKLALVPLLLFLLPLRSLPSLSLLLLSTPLPSLPSLPVAFFLLALLLLLRASNLTLGVQLDSIDPPLLVQRAILAAEQDGAHFICTRVVQLVMLSEIKAPAHAQAEKQGYVPIHAPVGALCSLLDLNLATPIAPHGVLHGRTAAWKVQRPQLWGQRQQGAQTLLCNPIAALQAQVPQTRGEGRQQRQKLASQLGAATAGERLESRQTGQQHAHEQIVGECVAFVPGEVAQGAGHIEVQVGPARWGG